MAKKKRFVQKAIEDSKKAEAATSAAAKEALAASEARVAKEASDAAAIKPIRQWTRILQRNLGSTVRESWPRLSAAILQHTAESLPPVDAPMDADETLNIVAYTSAVWKALSWEDKYSLMPHESKPVRNTEFMAS